MHQVLDKVVTLSVAPNECKWISLFADFAFKLTPCPGNHSAGPFHIDFAAMTLLSDPLAKTIQVNQSHAAIALASGDQRISAVTVTSPTDFTGFFI